LPPRSTLFPYTTLFRSPVSRVTGGDTIQYTNEELVISLFRGRVESRKGVARRLLHGDVLSPWGHGCCKERLDLSTVVGELSWLERGANNAKVAGSIPVLAILDIEPRRRRTMFLT